MSKQNKTLLMIRAYDQATRFVSDLAISNPVVFAPIVRIEPLNHEKALPVADMLIFSSSNAVRLYTDREKNCDAETVCVGSITAKIAGDLGFKVSQTFETAKLLIAHFRNAHPDTKRILYPRAETVSLDIASELADMGYRISDTVLYRQKFQPLTDQAKDLIESSSLVVPILSKETAKHFLESIVSLIPLDLTLVCISPSVASIYDDFSEINVKIAENPTRAALCAEIKACFNT
jgi:uroporphyrinogen-III synthase